MSTLRAVIRFAGYLGRHVTGLAAFDAWLTRRLAAKWDALAADCEAEGMTVNAADARFEAGRLRDHADAL